MMYYGDHMSGWGWFGATIGMIAFWGLLIALGVLVYRAVSGRHTGTGQSSDQTATDPRRILAERYARGEIDDDEYRRRLAALTGAGVPPHTADRR